MENLVLTNGNGVEVNYDGHSWRIDADSRALIVDDITTYIGDPITKGTTIQETFNKIFNDLLPKLPLIENSTMFKTSDDGLDPEYPEISGLRENAIYIRFTFINSETPMYISCWMIQSELERLDALVGEKANDSEFEVLKNLVEQKASTLQLTLLEQQLVNKADKDTVNKIQSQLSNKADVSKVNTIEQTINNKADKTLVENLQNQLNVLSDNIAGSITEEDIVEITNSIQRINEILTNKADKNTLTMYIAELDKKADKTKVNELSIKLDNIQNSGAGDVTERLDALANNILSLDKKVNNVINDNKKKADISYVERIDDDLKKAIVKLDTVTKDKADRSEVACKADYNDLLTVASTVNVVSDSIKTLETELSNKITKIDLNSKTDELLHKINNNYTEFRNHVKSSEITINGINKDISELEKKVDNIEDIAGKEWVQVLTPEQYKRLPSNRIDPAKFYLCVKFNKPYALYIGSVLIAERATSGSTGFAYTFPMTF